MMMVMIRDMMGMMGMMGMISGSVGKRGSGVDSDEPIAASWRGQVLQLLRQAQSFPFIWVGV